MASRRARRNLLTGRDCFFVCWWVVRRPASLLAVLLLTGVIHAAPRDPVAAEELFTEGRAAMEKGDYERACERFEASERLDPAAGTLINWAECLSRRGKPATSRLKWREALEALAPDDERRKAVEERIAALDAVVPRLELRLDASAPAGVIVQRDGVAVDPVTLGLPIPVDPGAHRIGVTAKDHAPSEIMVTLAQGEHRVLVLHEGPPLEPAPKKNVAAAPEREERHGLPVPFWIAAGIGVAGIVTGATFGALAIVQKDRMQDGCKKSTDALFCDASGLDAAHKGKTYATIADITVPIGVAGLGVGAWFLFSRPSSDAAVPATQGAMLRVSHVF